MAETSIHGAIHSKSSGDRTKQIPPPPPLRRRDVLSALPDDVIHHIFSFLNLRDVVKTSVLSKRWRSTWTSTTDLIFDDGIDDDGPCSALDFSSLVDSVLLQSTSPTVKRFHVMCDEANSPKFDFWLCFAEARRVEDLRLWLTASLFFYTLPRFVCRSSWLVRLEVRKCCFSLGTSIRWPCLKVLLISFAELSDDILEEIVRGSPVLEYLELQLCKGVKNIRIDSTSVKELILVLSTISGVEKLWAPHLLSLSVSGFWPYASMFRLDNVSSLMEANLYFVMSRGERMLDLLKGLLEKLREVPTIATDSRCLQILSHWEMEGVPSPLSKCQNLTLHARVAHWDLPGIAHLLQSSPRLENLLICLDGCTQFQFGLDDQFRERFNFEGEDFLCSRKGNFECLAKHLKRVEISGYEANSFGSKQLLPLIKFLLGNALVLEKLIIKSELSTGYGEKSQAAVQLKLLGVSQNVLSYRRVSQNAEVIFDYAFKELPF